MTSKPYLPELTAARLRIFRLTHIQNLPWIFTNGLHCQNSTTRDSGFVQIGNESLITKRALREVPVPPGGTLADYVPFYFTPSSIMLYNIITGYGGIKQHRRQDLVLLVASLRDLERSGNPCLVSPTHAYTRLATYHSVADGGHLIDWQLLQARDFSEDPADPQKKDRYQAEALVHRHVPLANLSGIATHDSLTRDRVRSMLPAGIALRVEAMPRWFFP